METGAVLDIWSDIPEGFQKKFGTGPGSAPPPGHPWGRPISSWVPRSAHPPFTADLWCCFPRLGRPGLPQASGRGQRRRTLVGEVRSVVEAVADHADHHDCQPAPTRANRRSAVRTPCWRPSWRPPTQAPTVTISPLPLLGAPIAIQFGRPTCGFDHAHTCRVETDATPPLSPFPCPSPSS